MHIGVLMTRPFLSRLPLIFVGLVLCVATIPAQAQWSSSSVFTEDGIEIGVDARVFSLFATFNAVGYDIDSIVGPEPLLRPQYAAARQKLRGNLGRQVLQDIQNVVDKHPKPIAEYVRAVLELGPAPKFESPKNASALAKALAEPLREWFNEEGGAALLKNVSEDAKALQKKLLPIIDGAEKAATKLVRLGEASEQLLDDAGAEGRVLVVINELDSHGTLHVIKTGDTTVVVAGPLRGAEDEERLVNAAVFAYAKTLVSREVKKVPVGGTLADGFAKLGDVVRKRLGDDKAYAVELLACAVVRQGRPKAGCEGLSGDAAADAALSSIAPRMATYASSTTLFPAAVVGLLAAGAGAPPAAPAEAPKPGKK